RFASDVPQRHQTEGKHTADGKVRRYGMVCRAARSVSFSPGAAEETAWVAKEAALLPDLPPRRMYLLPASGCFRFTRPGPNDMVSFEHFLEGLCGQAACSGRQL